MGSCQVVLTFLPTAAGVANAALEVSGMPGGMVSTALTGQGRFPAALSIAPTMQAFGTVTLGGSSMAQTFTVTNTGGSPTGVPSVTVTGTDGSMFTATSMCGAVLAPAGTCQVSVVFVPTSSGSKTATLEVSATPGGTATSQLSGTAQTPAALSGSPSPGSFGFAVVGSMSGSSLTFTISNQGEAASPPLTSMMGGSHAGDFIKGTDTCQGQTVAGGSSCTVSVRFQPSAAGARSGTLSVAGAGITPAVIPLAGTGLTPATLVLSTASQDFGSVATGSSTTAVIGVSNTGEVATGSPSFSTGGSAEFFVTTNTCGTSIAPGGNCSVTVRFGPSAVGNRTGMLTASANPGGAASASLTGIGVTPGALSISPTSRDFGGVQVGQSGGFEVFSITNTGGVTLSGLNITVGGGSASSFVKSNDTCTGSSLPPASGCVVRITFTPQAAGALSAYVQASEAGGTSVQAPLSGTGLRPASLSISPTSQSWPDTVVGTPGTTFTFTVTNDGDVASGTLSSTLLGVDASQFGFKSGGNTCTGTLAGQASCTIGITFTPTSGGVKQASLAVGAMPGGSATATLSGRGLTPAALTLAPAAGSSTNYGNVLLGTNVSMSFTVTNTGQQASGPLSLTLTGTDAAMFQVSSGASSCQLGQPLAGGASCTSSVRFTASTGSTRGMKSATLTASATPGSSPTLSLTANVQFPAQLAAAASNDFGGIEVGVNSSTYVWTVQNTGDVATGTLNLANTNSTEFQVASSTCTGSLGAGASCAVNVFLKPTAGGNRSGTLTLSATPGGSVALAMTGKGQWRLTIVASFTGGTVSTTDGRLTCGSTSCSALYDDGSAVTIRATTTNGSGFHFTSWVAPTGTNCVDPGHGYQCTVTMTAPVSANARFLAITENLIFVSSSTYPANLMSATEYDTRCNTLATAAGINNAAGNAYVAWMSTDTSVVTAATRLGTGKGAFRRMDHALFATSETDLLANKVLNAPNLDEYGRTTNGAVWTGTYGNGTANTPNDCTNWTSTSGTTEYGVSYGGPSRWTVAYAGLSCATFARIYCLMKTSTTTATNPTVPAGGKVAYITAPLFVPSSQGNGIGSLDTFCNNNKPTGFASRSFVAFAASTALTAGGRLSQTASYYRPDGQLIGTGAEIAAHTLRSGIWEASDLSYPGGEVPVWAGATNATTLATTATNCNNWTSSGTTGYGGRTNTVLSDFFGSFTGQSCTTGKRLYCAEP